jgi:hypothetical protein
VGDNDAGVGSDARVVPVGSTGMAELCSPTGDGEGTPLKKSRTRSRQKGGSGYVFVPDPFEDGRERYDAVVLAVPHREFRRRSRSDYVSLFSRVKPGVFVDVKGVFTREAAQARGRRSIPSSCGKAAPSTTSSTPTASCWGWSPPGASTCCCRYTGPCWTASVQRLPTLRGRPAAIR